MNRDQWQQVIDSDYQLPEGVSLHEATRELLDFLSSTDGFLRDTVGYFTLSAWIERGMYPEAELQSLLSWTQDNLRLGLGTSGHDSVFLRSFSVLILSEIIGFDGENPVLPEAERHAALERTLEYLAEECDLRGYVPEKGWAHAIAHGADALMVFAAHPHSTPTQILAVLDSIQDLVLMEHVYLYSEEKRLARAAHAALARLGTENIHLWLEHTLDRVQPDWYASPEQAAARLNLQGFLNALVLISKETEQHPLQEAVQEALLQLR
ncbi:DUF2785 domain-containing protein [Deinococcus roseus]|uniref:Membrane protein n=1 Tax=Deinococcus roseus TaxID=392414 RepID=A0ABQ2D3G1_9DEIO|nr:DUF2785 domain-containing protein [Deinococcus roseus]GGJ40965.1 membrane protein [Deinococcus roseus]